MMIVEVFLSISSETKLNARQRSQIQTRHRLLTAATLLFSQYGVGGTKAADIAQSAEVAIGTFYLHFRDKQSILGEILAAGIEELKLALSDLPDTLSQAELIKARMQRIVAFMAGNQPLARVLFMPEVLATPPGAEIVNYLVKSQEVTILQQQEMNLVKQNLSASLCARAFVGMLVQLLGWWVLNPGSADSVVICDTLTELRTAILTEISEDQT